MGLAIVFLLNLNSCCFHDKKEYIDSHIEGLRIFSTISIVMQ